MFKSFALTNNLRCNIKQSVTDDGRQKLPSDLTVQMFYKTHAFAQTSVEQQMPAGVSKSTLCLLGNVPVSQ